MNSPASPWSSPTRGGSANVAIFEENFVAEESEFVCEGAQAPLVPDRSMELALETWNLKKTILEFNSQILQLKNEVRTQKNLTKNLQKIVTSVTNENTVRAKENINLRSTVTALEKQVQELNAQNLSLTNNLNRHKRVGTNLQTRLTEVEKSFSTLQQERYVMISH
jgi:chromosome segregation ATPase